MGDRPLRSPTHRGLGGPLPRQLPNGTHARPPPTEAFQRQGMSLGVGMGYYPAFPPAVPRKRVGCIRVTHPCATLMSPRGHLPFDLHVLGLPLAFILSQDQTLHCIIVVLKFFLIKGSAMILYLTLETVQPLGFRLGLMLASSFQRTSKLNPTFSRRLGLQK